MGARQPMISFPAWTQTVASMLAAGGEINGTGVRMICSDRCSRYRAPDLPAIIAAKGEAYSLVNKRFACRWKPHCPGWIRPFFQSGVYRPLWDDATGRRWDEEDRATGDQRRAMRVAGLKRLGTFRDRFTVGVVDLDSLLTTEDLDAILGRRIRAHDVKPIRDATKRVVWNEGDPAPAEPPLGVDAWSWNNAPDDRARRRLIRNARG